MGGAQLTSDALSGYRAVGAAIVAHKADFPRTHFKRTARLRICRVKTAQLRVAFIKVVRFKKTAARSPAIHLPESETFPCWPRTDSSGARMRGSSLWTIGVDALCPFHYVCCGALGVSSGVGVGGLCRKMMTNVFIGSPCFSCGWSFAPA